jgi:fructose-1-phosphate kinase PfkB-like protein
MVIAVTGVQIIVIDTDRHILREHLCGWVWLLHVDATEHNALFESPVTTEIQ